MPVPLCIFAWLMIQTAAILLAALRVPLWYHAPANSESLALPILLTLQLLSASLLFPRLTVNRQTALMTIAAVWPYASLAGLLAASPVSVAVYAGFYASAWIASLWIWRMVLSDSLAQMTGVAIFTAWNVAGPVLMFIRAEYGANSAEMPSGLLASALLGPLINSIQMVQHAVTGPIWWPCMVFAWPILLASGILWGKTAFRKP